MNINYRSFKDVRDYKSYHILLPELVIKLIKICKEGDNKLDNIDTIKNNIIIPISIHDYIIRLCKYMHCSPAIFIITYILIKRLYISNNIKIASCNIHSIFLSTFIIAAKLHDDIYYSNIYYANIGGINIKEINKLEIYILDILKWNTYVSEQELINAEKEISFYKS